MSSSVLKGQAAAKTIFEPQLRGHYELDPGVSPVPARSSR